MISHAIYDEVVWGPATLYTQTPPPKRGGTFLYCTEPVESEVPKLDKLGRKTRYTEITEQPCSKRFRLMRKYRQHFRRSHLNRSVASPQSESGTRSDP